MHLCSRAEHRLQLFALLLLNSSMCCSCCLSWAVSRFDCGIIFGFSKYWKIANILNIQHNSGGCHKSWVVSLPWLFAPYFTKLLVSPGHCWSPFALVLPGGRRATAVSGDLTLEEEYEGTQPGGSLWILLWAFSEMQGFCHSLSSSSCAICLNSCFYYTKNIPQYLASLQRYKPTHF